MRNQLTYVFIKHTNVFYYCILRWNRRIINPQSPFAGPHHEVKTPTIMLKHDKHHLKKQLTFSFIKTTQQLPQSILTECVFPGKSSSDSTPPLFIKQFPRGTLGISYTDNIVLWENEFETLSFWKSCSSQTQQPVGSWWSLFCGVLRSGWRSGVFGPRSAGSGK